MSNKISPHSALFILISIFITYVSILFPQKVGSYKIVAGWPVTMYRFEYKRTGEITNTGQIIRRIERSKNIVMQERVLLNIILWTILFQLTWFGYHKYQNKNRTSRFF